eukprot:TRINITY_DN10559_c0_g1_i1.p1 TRINITY_DN10559_c0_g1~~TRINITY_DN10559_c0_g1_i1.p1  ORF type:complete len:276 (-),score=38.64 TRINITY_DN10559_c0_g1_i1:272-1099(-)
MSSSSGNLKPSYPQERPYFMTLIAFFALFFSTYYSLISLSLLPDLLPFLPSGKHLPAGPLLPLLILSAVLTLLILASMSDRAKVKERVVFIERVENAFGGFKGSERILDVGCGVGCFMMQAAKVLQERQLQSHDTANNQGRVLGVDKFPGEFKSKSYRLALAMHNAKAEGVSDLVSIVEGDACKLEYADNSFDVVLCEYCLHHVKGRDAALKEFTRVCKPGGVICLLDAEKMIVKSFEKIGVPRDQLKVFPLRHQFLCNLISFRVILYQNRKPSL